MCLHPPTTRVVNVSLFRLGSKTHYCTVAIDGDTIEISLQLFHMLLSSECHWRFIDNCKDVLCKQCSQPTTYWTSNSLLHATVAKRVSLDQYYEKLLVFRITFLFLL